MEAFRLLTEDEMLSDTKVPRVATKHARMERVLADVTGTTLDLMEYARAFARVVNAFRCEFNLSVNQYAEHADGEPPLRPRIRRPSEYGLNTGDCILSVECIAAARTVAAIAEAQDWPGVPSDRFWIENPDVTTDGSQLTLRINPPAWRDFIDDPSSLYGDPISTTGKGRVEDAEWGAVFRSNGRWYLSLDIPKSSRVELPKQLLSAACAVLQVPVPQGY